MPASPLNLAEPALSKYCALAIALTSLSAYGGGQADDDQAPATAGDSTRSGSISTPSDVRRANLVAYHNGESAHVAAIVHGWMNESPRSKQGWYPERGSLNGPCSLLHLSLDGRDGVSRFEELESAALVGGHFDLTRPSAVPAGYTLLTPADQSACRVSIDRMDPSSPGAHGRGGRIDVRYSDVLMLASCSAPERSDDRLIVVSTELVGDHDSLLIRAFDGSAPSAQRRLFVEGGIRTPFPLDRAAILLPCRTDVGGVGFFVGADLGSGFCYWTLSPSLSIVDEGRIPGAAKSATPALLEGGSLEVALLMEWKVRSDDGQWQIDLDSLVVSSDLQVSERKFSGLLRGGIAGTLWPEWWVRTTDIEAGIGYLGASGVAEGYEFRLDLDATGSALNGVAVHKHGFQQVLDGRNVSVIRYDRGDIRVLNFNTRWVDASRVPPWIGVITGTLPQTANAGPAGSRVWSWQHFPLK